MENWARIDRRKFLQCAGAAAVGTVVGIPGVVAGLETKPAATSESLVKTFYGTLSEKQRGMMCFGWDYEDKEKGLLRTRIENNWRITKPTINSDFYTADQQAMIRAIFEGMTNPDWHGRIDQQLKDDIGGYGNKQAVAIFGEPDSGRFQFAITSRHLTLRCDGDSAEHVAFGGPILYGHEGQRLYEKPDHPGNVYWYQAQEANKLFSALDAAHQKKALLLEGMPSEEEVEFHGEKGGFQGVPISELADDQKGEVQRILRLLIEPFRQSDRDEVVKCLNAQGGLDACSLAFYKEGDLGEDGIYDNWRIEGPSFVWYFRGTPHVHVWVHVADDASVKLNSFQDSVGV
jgi:hypothetical protein